jgi:Putative Ig domain/Cohesin domain
MGWNILCTAVNGHGQCTSRRRLAGKHRTTRSYKPCFERLECRSVPAITLSGPSIIVLASSHVVGGYGALLEDTAGNLFGVTGNGGAFNHGLVFELSKGSSAINVLATFDGTNGSGPNALIEDSNGNLFGTTTNYAVGYGTVFEVQQGSGVITTLATFDNTPHGAYPFGLVEDTSGNLFGVTRPGGGGYYNDGSVFELAKGSSTIVNLAGFSGYNGYDPECKLVLDSNGNIFGTTFEGGPTYFSDDGYGTVFELKKDSHTITSLAAFGWSNGASPQGNVVLDSNGNLFSTAAQGGAFNDGTLFEVRKGSGAISTLVNFSGDNGFSPPGSGLVQDSFGNLFGTTAGAFNGTGGTVFELPKGSNTINTLAAFDRSNWVSDTTPLVLDSAGNLYDIANDFPTSATTVFELRPVFPNATVNQRLYNQTLTATGGSGLMTFSVTAGNLPPGLTLSSAGVLTGSPNAVGTYQFTITATDSTGAAGSGMYTMNVNPAVSITTPSLPSGTAGTAYSQSITGSGGTGTVTYSETGTLPTGLTLSSNGLLAGTPTTAGTYTFTVTATDSVGVSTSQNYSLVIAPGAFAQYQIAVAGPSTVPAGGGFLVTVQAADAYGNPITNYNGPSTVTATLTPGSTASNLPTTVAINGNGLGLFLVTIPHAGSYSISVADSSGNYTGSSPTVSVTPGSSARLAFAAQPVDTPTGVTLPAVTVQVLDAFGNVVTGDNADTVTLGIGSGPGPFTAGSTTTAAVHNGVATFNNITLVKPGAYTLTEIVTGLYTGPVSSTFSVVPLQVVSGSFAGTPSGFSLQFNAPILVNSVTPVLFGQGFGATAPPPSITLTGPGGPVIGSLVVSTATNTITFVQTDTTSFVNSATPVLPDGVYVVDVSSSAATNGFQALNSGGGFLDGKGTGTPGSGDFTATFTVKAAAAHDDVIWVPPTADGPLQNLNAPGNNQVGGGYPIYIDDTTGTVTSVQVTINYNTSMLTVTGATSNSALPGSSFTLLGSSTPGHAVLQYTGSTTNATHLMGGQVALGFLTASVPNSSPATPIYHGKDLLHLSGIAVSGTGGAVPVVGADALHVVAFVGDADGNGNYSSSDAVLITRVAVSTDSGFVAYPLVDPTVVADTDGSGFIPSDAALQANEAGVGFPTANLANPPIPPGANVTPIGNNVDPTLSLPGHLQVSAGGTVTVPVNLDDPHPEGSTGLAEAHLALTYDPHQFTVSAADIHAGSLLAAGGWTLVPTIDQATGQIGITLYSETPITSSLGGSLVTIDFHPVAGNLNPSTIQLAASANPNGQLVSTELQDAQGTYTLTFGSTAIVISPLRTSPTNGIGTKTGAFGGQQGSDAFFQALGRTPAVDWEALLLSSQADPFANGFGEAFELPTMSNKHVSDL